MLYKRTCYNDSCACLKFLKLKKKFEKPILNLKKGKYRNCKINFFFNIEDKKLP